MKLGIVDTTFSRVNMGAIALDEIAKNKGGFGEVSVVRKTVPGIKDLPVECALLFEKEKCDIVMALGMAGNAQIDEVCAHESSSAIQQVMLKHSKHIIEVFVHMKESVKNGKLDEKGLLALCEDRVRKHVHNAIWLVQNPQKLVERAGSGRRQGRKDEGEIKI